MNEKTLNYLATNNNVTVEAVEALWKEFEARQNNKPWKVQFSQVASLQAELRSRIAFYEEVVSNTLRKFPHYNTIELTRLSVNNALVAVTRGETTYQLNGLPEDFVLERTDLLHFSAPEKDNLRYYRIVKVPARLLWNDPIAVSVHTRAAVRKAQKAWAETTKKNASVKTQTLKNDLAKLQKELEASQALEEKLAAQGKESWESRLETLNAEERIGASSLIKLQSVLKGSKAIRKSRPGIFEGEEEDSIRLEWLGKDELTTFEINKAGAMDLFYNNDDGVSLSAEPTTVKEALVFLHTHLVKHVEVA